MTSACLVYQIEYFENSWLHSMTDLTKYAIVRWQNYWHCRTFCSSRYTNVWLLYTVKMCHQSSFIVTSSSHLT